MNFSFSFFFLFFLRFFPDLMFLIELFCVQRLNMVHELSLGYHFAPESMIFHSKFASSILEGVG